MSDNLEPGRTDMFVPGPHDNAEPHEGVRESAPTKRVRPCVHRAVRRRAPAA